MKCSGYTLIEVLMATTVLALGLAAVFGLTRSALRKSVDAAELADAQLACQTSLNEILAQQTPVKPILLKDIEGLAGWKMTINIYDSPRPTLCVLHISAQKYTPNGDNAYGVLYQLLRWVPEHKVERPKQNDMIEPIEGFEDPFW